MFRMRDILCVLSSFMGPGDGYIAHGNRESQEEVIYRLGRTKYSSAAPLGKDD